MQNEQLRAEKAKKTSIGGQALIEGVMMRGPFLTAMAVRNSAGEIVTEQWDTNQSERPKWQKLPFIRGIFNMVSSLVVGYKSLMRSAELSGLDAEEDAADKKKREDRAYKKLQRRAKKTGEPVPAREEFSLPEQTEPGKAEKFLFSVAMVLSVVLGVGLAVVLFMWLPIFLYNNVMKAIFPALQEGHRWIQSVFEGVLRLIIFLVYVYLVSFMKDIRRVFMYHGAEHKSIFCYEQGLELTVENVRPQSRSHPRCGTSFLVLALIVGILVSLCIPIYDNTLLRAAVKILLIPVVVGCGYELIKLAGRKDNWFTRLISKPGLWVQRITTREPEDDMIECAITSLKMVIPEDPEADNW